MHSRRGFRPRRRLARTGSGRCRPHRVRPQRAGQPGSGRAHAPRRAAERSRPGNVLHAWGCRVYRLSGAGRSLTLRQPCRGHRAASMRPARSTRTRVPTGGGVLSVALRTEPSSMRTSTRYLVRAPARAPERSGAASVRNCATLDTVPQSTQRDGGGGACMRPPSTEGRGCSNGPEAPVRGFPARAPAHAAADACGARASCTGVAPKDCGAGLRAAAAGAATSSAASAPAMPGARRGVSVSSERPCDTLRPRRFRTRRRPPIRGPGVRGCGLHAWPCTSRGRPCREGRGRDGRGDSTAPRRC